MRAPSPAVWFLPRGIVHCNQATVAQPTSIIHTTQRRLTPGARTHAPVSAHSAPPQRYRSQRPLHSVPPHRYLLGYFYKERFLPGAGARPLPSDVIHSVPQRYRSRTVVAPPSSVVKSLWEVFVWGFGVLFLSCVCVGVGGVVLCRSLCVCV